MTLVKEPSPSRQTPTCKGLDNMEETTSIFHQIADVDLLSTYQKPDAKQELSSVKLKNASYSGVHSKGTESGISIVLKYPLFLEKLHDEDMKKQIRDQLKKHSKVIHEEHPQKRRNNMSPSEPHRPGSSMSADDFVVNYPNLNVLYLLTRDRTAAQYKPVTARAIVAWLNSTMYAVTKSNLPYDQWDESLPADVAEKAHAEWLQALVDLKLAPS